MQELNMKQFVCKNCGGKEYVQLGNCKIECKSCGERYILDDTLSGETRNLLNTADVKLAEMDFVSAKNFYLKAIEKDENSIEGYFGVISAKYGIEYVKDKKDGENQYKPTCHRCSRGSVLADDYTKKLLQLLIGNELEKDYICKLQAIEDTRSKINELAKTESPYDVFICFKAEKELAGSIVKTDDYNIGYQIYHDLKASGQKVFFSPETLKGKGGQNYEPIIFNALETSPVMIVLCTDSAEFMDAVWVKNEWSRFLELMERDTNKKLIPVFRNTAKMSFSQLPQEMLDKKLQALDQADYDFKKSLIDSVINAKSNYLRGVSGVIKKRDLSKKPAFNVDKKLDIKKIEKRKFAESVEQIVIPQKTENLLKMAQIPLEAGKFNKALTLFSNILKDDGSQYLAVWGTILSKCECRNAYEFALNGAQVLQDYASFEKLLSIAPQKNANEYYENYLSSFFNNAVSLVNAAKFDKAFDVAAKWADDAQAKHISARLFEESLKNAFGKEFKISDKLLLVSIQLLGENDAQLYIERNLALSDKWRGVGKFDIAIDYCNRVLKVSAGDKKAAYNLFLCNLAIVDESVGKLNFAIKDSAFMDKFEKLVECGCDVDLLFANIIELAFQKVKDNKIKLGEKIFERSAEIMLSLVSEDDYNSYISNFADLLLFKGEFDFAKKYYMQLLSIDSHDASAHWGLLKVEYKCNSDCALLLLSKKKDWTTSTEFANVIGACDGSESAEYLEFQLVYEQLDKTQEKAIKARMQNYNAENNVDSIVHCARSIVKSSVEEQAIYRRKAKTKNKSKSGGFLFVLKVVAAIVFFPITIWWAIFWFMNGGNKKT